MKITPHEIRQYSFEKTFRGYNVEEVDAFLASLAQEWERIGNDSKMLRMELDMAEKEANKLREVEMTLFKTLKTAEETSSRITEQANIQADIQVKDAQNKVEKMLKDAETQAKSLVEGAEIEAKNLTEGAEIQAKILIENAEQQAKTTVEQAQEKATNSLSVAETQAQTIKDEVLEEVRAFEQNYKTLQAHRDNLLVQLRSLANTTNEHVETFATKFNLDAVADKLQAIREEETPKSVIQTEILEQEIEENQIIETIEETPQEVVEAATPEQEIEEKQIVEAIEETPQEVVELEVETATSENTEIQTEEVATPFTENTTQEAVIEEVGKEIQVETTEETTPVAALLDEDAPKAATIETSIPEIETLTENTTEVTEQAPPQEEVKNVAIQAEPEQAIAAITEEMLERVNKVKLAIRKAMNEKTESTVSVSNGLPTVKDVVQKSEEAKTVGGGSFFDNIKL